MSIRPKVLNKNIWKKFLIVLMFIMAIAIISPTHVRAEDSDDGIAGKLAKPIADFVLGIGDGLIDITNSIVIGQEMSLIRLDFENGFKLVVAIVAGVIAAAVAIAAVCLITTGVGAVVAAILAKTSILTATTTIGVGFIASVAIGSGFVGGFLTYNADFWGDVMVLPLYTLSPESIFQGNIGLFNVNFFDTDKIYSKDGIDWIVAAKVEATGDKDTSIKDFLAAEVSSEGINISQEELTKHKKNTYTLKNHTYTVYEIDGLYSSKDQDENCEYKYKLIRNSNNVGNNNGGGGNTGLQGDSIWTLTKYKRGGTNIAETLQPMIANWYVILRDIAIVAMLSVLVYIGIRILISSVAEDKAKYKQLMMDWIIGLCMLFLMHYGMAFGNTIVDKVTDLLNSAKQPTYINNIEYTSKVKNKLSEYIKDGTISVYGGDADNPIDASDAQSIANAEKKSGSTVGDYDLIIYKGNDGKDYILWNTNLMGMVRMQAQYARESSVKYLGYVLLFLVEVFFLLFFLVTYVKRVIYMAFLTIIAPFVALMYPIDKVRDGKAQTFDFWFKEYLFNLLLQPLHLMLYTILVSSALELAVSNIVYALIALGFLVPAEKLIRQMFGFQGQTPGFMPGANGSALMFSGMNRLLGRAPNEQQDDSKKDGGSGTSSSSSTSRGAKTADFGNVLESGASAAASTIGAATSAGKRKAKKTGGTSSPTKVPVKRVGNGNGKSKKKRQALGPKNNAGSHHRYTPNRNANVRKVKANAVPKPKANIPIALGKEHNKKRPNMRTRIGLMAKQIGKNSGRKLANKARTLRPGRFVAGAFLGGAGATLGAAMGIAEGSPSHALSHGATGGLAAYKAGRGLESAVESSIGAQEAWDEVYETTKTSDEADEERVREFKNDNKFQIQTSMESEYDKSVLDSTAYDGRQIRYSLLANNSDFKGHDDEEAALILAQSGVDDRIDLSTKEGQTIVKNAKRMSEQWGGDTFDLLSSSQQDAVKETLIRQSAYYDTYKEKELELKNARKDAEEKLRIAMENKNKKDEAKARKQRDKATKDLEYHRYVTRTSYVKPALDIANTWSVAADGIKKQKDRAKILNEIRDANNKI